MVDTSTMHLRTLTHHEGEPLMGSSTSQPRDGHERPAHLSKVGSPANLAWVHRMHIRQLFGPSNTRLLFVFIALVAVAGLILVTL
ncbi:MAG: hypothetical protein JWM34_1498 [Ilumatobacteraceae bacterium]|nr:hypothetical protein [Ilumatobacteraceae bacterium]